MKRVLLPMLLCAAIAASAGTHRVSAPACDLDFNSGTGDLVGIAWKSPSLEIIQEPRLGENFRLLLPLPGYEANYFLSREQKVGRIEQTPAGVTLHYDELRNARQTLPVKVRYHIGTQDGRLRFSIDVDNPTGQPLAEVLFGIIGGNHGLAGRTGTESLVPGLNANLAPRLLTNFQAGGYGGGNLGIRHAATGFTYPGAMTMSWIDLFNRKAGIGMYYANEDPEARVSAIVFELRPFDKSLAGEDNWPSPSELPAGEPIGMTFGWVNFPYTVKGAFHGGPVALQIHPGDWHEGSHLYRAWFDRHFTIQRSPSWLRKEMAWQSVILSNCEDETVYRFRDLPKLAADARKYGVTTFEILGWDTGGIDRGYPQYTPDPRLGTHEEFRQALSAIARMGVHPLIFANILQADTATQWYKDELHRYAIHRRWAPDLAIQGWGEGTIGARLGLARSNMTMLSPGHPEVRRLLLDQYAKLVEDGAHGFQLDKVAGLGILDFNPRLKAAPDRSVSRELVSFYPEIHNRMRRINPEFALASETWWDRLFPYIDVSYIRMNAMDMPSTALRYTFPEWTSTIFGENPGDFAQMNNGMRYGLVWAMAPRHYNDSMDEPLTRPLSRYVQELIRIRKRHAGVLFHGRFRDTLGAEVKAGAGVRYSVFEGRGQPAKAVVAVNFGRQPAKAEIGWTGGGSREAELLIPFQKDSRVTLPAQITIPPGTVAVVVGQ